MNAKIDEWLQKRKAKRPGLSRAFVVSVPRAVATGSTIQVSFRLDLSFYLPRGGDGRYRSRFCNSRAWLAFVFIKLSSD